MRIGRLWAITGILALAMLAAACGGSDGDSGTSSTGGAGTSGGQAAGSSQPTTQASNIRRGGTLVVALEQNPKSFDPRVYTDTYSGVVVDQVIETLAKYDEQVQPQPWLAEKIDI